MTEVRQFRPERPSGERKMLAIRGKALVAAVLCSFAMLTSPLRAADDDAALRQKALSLNTITGENPIKGRIKMLVEDAAGTKKMLPVAAALAKGKDQPFTYNAAYILARTAQELKDFESS